MKSRTEIKKAVQAAFFGGRIGDMLVYCHKK
jgi:hypothetical protein